MMKRIVSFLAILHCFFFAFSQREIVPTATEFIRTGNFSEADKYLDSILKIQPQNVDALMMKGNVILNDEFLNRADYFAINANLESVFDTTSINLETGIKIIPVAAARQVERFWKQCLLLDSSRTDIRKGLCSLYAMALMKAELKMEIPDLLKREKNEDGELAFKTANYARQLKQRGDFDGAMEIYQLIAQQFPGLAGIRCDIGSEFFYEGRMKEAVQYLDSALSERNIDETTYLNAAFIYSELGYFDKAYAAFKGYSRDFHTKMDIFYQGLILFSKADAGYTVVLKNFATSIDSNAYYPEYRLANRLLAYPDTARKQDFLHLIEQDIPEWYKPLIYEQGMMQFPHNCEPFIGYGAFQAGLKNFLAAEPLLKTGENWKMTKDYYEEWELDYAYVLFKNNEGKKAMMLFKSLYSSGDIFKQQAAKYFVAKILLDENKPDEAKKLLRGIEISETPSKYLTLAVVLLQQIR